eukprot:3187886-Pyramimonas_sp.AAC.1
MSAHEHDMHAPSRMFQHTPGSDLAMVAKTEMKHRSDTMPVYTSFEYLHNSVRESCELLRKRIKAGQTCGYNHKRQ